MKNKKKVLGILYIFIMYAALLACIKLSPVIDFSIDIMFFATLFITYVALHFFLNIKELYNNMFKYRYWIAGIFFAILVFGGYHGSSMGMWNNYINPNVSVKNSKPILGISRGIRSDEWLVGTPYTLSQFSDSVNFSGSNDLINAKETDVTFFPRLVQKNYTIILTPSNLGYLFLPNEMGFSFSWYFNYFAIFLITIELLMIITKKNKLYSVLGAFLITFAPAIVWWNSCAIQLYGETALLIIYSFLKIKKVWVKTIMALLLGWIAACYILTMYPAWQLPYGYFFLVIFIWMIFENKKDIRWRDSLYLIITGVVCALLVFPLYFGASKVYEVISNTVYPGDRASYGGGNWYFIFDYIGNIFLPYSNTVVNASELSQYISFYPLPLLVGLYYIYKNKKEKRKNDVFLILTSILSILLTLWCFLPLPKLLSKITLMTMSTPDRAQLVLGYISIFMLIYILNKYETSTKIKKMMQEKKILGLVSFMIFGVVLLLSNKTMLVDSSSNVNIYTNIISIIVFVPLFYFIILNNRKLNRFLSIALIILSVLSTIYINPLSKGLSVFYEKPFSKEIKSIISENEKAKFLVVNNNFVIPNYILANGGRTINSVNFVPNLELWGKLDLNKQYDNVYNRYSHVGVDLTNEKTSFELIQDDLMKIKLSYNDICITGANYLVSDAKLQDNNSYTEIYHANNIYIYETFCSESGE